MNDRRLEYLSLIKSLRKSDLHSHAGRGGNKKFIEEFYGVKIENPPERFLSLKNMQEWYVANIRDITCDKIGVIKRWEAAFRQANEDNIAILVLSFGMDENAVETLHLSEVHHGIASADSLMIMKWLADNKIRLNVCPTSNVMLGLTPSYKTHPIKKLFHAGIPVTINTDDMLIFNQSVSEEYVNLLCAGTLNIDEIEKIRLTGLGEIVI